jgi:ketopantoate reductase
VKTLGGGISDRVKRIAEIFTAAGLETVASEDIMKDIWKKLMANIGINAMSALCNFRVGEIFDVPETKETILEALEEAALVALGKKFGDSHTCKQNPDRRGEGFREKFQLMEGSDL